MQKGPLSYSENNVRSDTSVSTVAARNLWNNVAKLWREDIHINLCSESLKFCEISSKHM